VSGLELRSVRCSPCRGRRGRLCLLGTIAGIVQGSLALDHPRSYPVNGMPAFTKVNFGSKTGVSSTNCRGPFSVLPLIVTSVQS
jgi:hypothetical protein